MRYSRAGIVAVLLAAEVFVGGAILWSLTGGHPGWPAQGADFHRVSEAPGKTFAPIDAGASPHVIVDDPDSRVVITASNDGQVHVTDDTHTAGWVWGASGVHAPLDVRRTADGVSVRRGDGRLRIAFFGFSYQHTDVAVPPGAFVDVQRCGGAQLTGLAGQVRIHSVDGSIRGRDLRVTGGEVQSDEGSIRLAFAGSNLHVFAKTGDGSIHFDGRRIRHDGDAAAAEYQIGAGGAPLQVSTQDGSIHIDTNGAQ